MFEFLSAIYCNLIGWIITPSTCSLHRRSDEHMFGHYGGKSKCKTKRHRKHRKNKTYKH